MSISVENTTLMRYLQVRDTEHIYFSKILELRQMVTKWLAYIPRDFPHYTQHTIEHSDEIVRQLSLLLFEDEDAERPQTISLSAIEVYILIAAAYLHDAGMVVPDQEKREILSSESWKSWINADSKRLARWKAIQALRTDTTLVDVDVRNFVADMQSRFIIAEYVRKDHHKRAANVIAQHQQALGRFALDDPMLARAITNVCIGHGLSNEELEDSYRYPEQADILGYRANIRFLAILLRLGDLLDMSVDRACPLLLNAANPIPTDSLPRWTKYQRILQRTTSPRHIGLIAECNTQDEHRFLQDWCQWLVKEVESAGASMARCSRHNQWKPPIATTGGPSPSIDIHPSASATYRPSKWTFQLDQEAIFQRLIYDVYHDPNTYIRELIQNGLDATRCQVFHDLSKRGIQVPEFPTQVEQTIRDTYPMHITLSTKQVLNELSEEVEEKQVLTVEDSGLGMDRDIIEHYFLQIGRSYYTTEEFRRSYHFIPTSRFGLGFLSVFAVSDQIIVDTYKPTSQKHDEPILLTLTGPRNYLLTERGSRQSNGTKIELLLRDPMQIGTLTKLVQDWCRRVEFPIYINDLGVETVVVAERPEQFTYETMHTTGENARFVLRSFPVNRHGIEGELYIFAYFTDQGEWWNKWDRASVQHDNRNIMASSLTMPAWLRCVHGITIYQGKRTSSYSARLDFRGAQYKTVLSREAMLPRKQTLKDFAKHDPMYYVMRLVDSFESRESIIEPELVSRWEEILAEHLATSQPANSHDNWLYKHELAKVFADPLLVSFWLSLPGMIPIQKAGNQSITSIADVQAMPVFAVIIKVQQKAPTSITHKESYSDEITPTGESSNPSILWTDLKRIASLYQLELFKDRSIGSIKWLDSDHLEIDWTLSDNKGVCFTFDDETFRIVDFPGEHLVGARLDFGFKETILNSNNMLAQWIVRVWSACEQRRYGLSDRQSEVLLSVLVRYFRGYGQRFDEGDLSDLIDHLTSWQNIPNLPPELYPPELTLHNDMFYIMPWNQW